MTTTSHIFYISFLLSTAVLSWRDSHASANAIPLRVTETPARQQYHNNHELKSTDRVFMPIVRQGGSDFKDNATLVPLPGQPDRMVQMLFSIIASNTGFTPTISRAIIECLTEVSGTDSRNWGPYRLDRFTPTLVQVEHFALVSEEESLTFPSTVDPFIRDGELTKCVLNKDVGLPNEATLLEGRTVIAPESGAIVSSTGSTPGWAIGAALGAVALVAVVLLIIVSCNGEQVYKEEDYDEFVDDEIDNGDDMESGDEEFSVLSVDSHQRLETELRSIAGQRNVGIVSLL